MDDSDLSGFVVNKHHMESETLDSKIAKEIMKIILADFKKRSSSWMNNTRVLQNCVSDLLVLRLLKKPSEIR